jgi:site-specific recombinase XerD
MTAPESASRKPKQLDAGGFQPEISSFRLHLTAEGKAAKTVRTYTEAVQWFAGEYLLMQAGGGAWEQVTRQDVQQWIVWLLDCYSSAYASNQYRALQQFFRWLAGEEEIPDPMAGAEAAARPGKARPDFR